MKYFILFISSLIIEIAATYYIGSVANKNSIGMIFFAFIGPFLGLPFIKYQIESKTNIERFKLALCSGIGYASGSAIVSILILYKIFYF
jgi:hypothetical protein